MRFALPKYQRLIELVRQHPPLYDSSLPEHRDPQLQMDIWQKIATVMNDRHMGWEDWKKVWKHKRDAFTKKRRAIHMCRSPAEVRKITKGPLFDQMMFLVDYLSLGRNTTSSLSDAPDVYNDMPEGSLDGESESFQGKQEMEEDEEEESSDITKLPWSTAAMLQPGSPATYTDDSNQNVAGNMMSEAYAATESPSTSSSLRKMSYGQLGMRGVNTPRIGTYTKVRDLDEYESKLNILIDLLSESSSVNMASIQTLVAKLTERNDDPNIFSFLSRKMKSFSEPTQQWLEDEVLKIYMEAKRRDREAQATEPTVPADDAKAPSA